VQSLLGFSPEELLGVAVRQLFHAEDAARAAAIADALADCTPLRDAEVQARRHDGSKLDISVSASPIRDGHGQLSCCLTVWRDLSARKRGEHALTAEHPFGYAAAYELVLAEERERLRIARGMHDAVEQAVAVAKLSAEQLLRNVPLPDVQTGAARIRALLDEASHAIRCVAVELGSPLLQQLGLEAGLRSLGERVARQCAIRFELEIEPELGAVSEETRLLLFRLARELLLNIQMHARARNAKLSLRRVANCLYLNVVDDGVGFRSEHAAAGLSFAGGFGLFSIGAQVTGAGGRLELQTSPGAGTRALIVLPLPDAAEPQSAAGRSALGPQGQRPATRGTERGAHGPNLEGAEQA
jgi:PAS domain S-box-containing protein